MGEQARKGWFRSSTKSFSKHSRFLGALKANTIATSSCDQSDLQLKMAVGRIQHEESITASFKFVHSTSILGRKRVAISRAIDSANLASPFGALSPKRHGRRLRMEKLNRLECLPQDILVKILCKVNHSDLKQLLLVSKTMNGATLIARELHFAFSTPISKPVFKRQTNVSIDSEGSEEAPYAPKQQRVVKSRLDGVKFSGIAVALFTSLEDE